MWPPGNILVIQMHGCLARRLAHEERLVMTEKATRLERDIDKYRLYYTKPRKVKVGETG